MSWRKESPESGGTFDLATKTVRLKELDDTIDSDPGFWSDPLRSATVLREKKALENTLKKAAELGQMLEDLSTALELAPDEEEFQAEAVGICERLRSELSELEVESLLGGEYDNSAGILTINAGAGGTESCDWASMLFRMYLRFAERKGWEVAIHDVQDGDDAGIKSAAIEVSGDFAFGLLNAESGVHRLVRISPFDSNARRHTSFASIYVSPVIDDNIEININPSELRIDTYRASGAGGQHVNRTDSAVRITHEPSGIVVQCQSQRSQHQNRDTAMKMLRSKLYDLELAQRRKKQQDIEASKAEIGFGSQIRSYVLHPYKMVKDHRTGHESHAPNEVLDGGISPFINAWLQRQRGPGG